MFIFYVLSFFKKGNTNQGGTLYKVGHNLRKYGKLFSALLLLNLAKSLFFTEFHYF